MGNSDIKYISDCMNIIEYSSMIIQSVDLRGNLLYTNESWKNILGYTHEDLIGKSVFSLLSIKSTREYQNILNMARDGIEPGKQEFIYLTHNGEEIILSGLISILRNQDGEIIGTSEFLKLTAYIDEPFNVTVPDYSRNQRSHSFVNETKKKYSDNIILGLDDLNSPINRFLDSIYDLVFFKDISGVYRGCNKNFAALLNLPKDKIIGYTDYDLYPEDIADIFTEKDHQILKDMTPRKNEEWVTLGDGSKSFMETLKTPYLGTDNSLVGFLGISRDISERKRAEEVLAENEMWLNVYFTQSNNAKFFLMLEHPINWEEAEDKDVALKKIFYNLKVNRINPAMLKLYGATEEEIFQENIPASFIGDFKETKNHWMMLMNNSNLSIVSKALRRNGEEIHVSGDYMCLYNDQRSLIGIFGTLRDITKEILSEKETKERELFLRTVLETTRDGYYVLDEDLKIIDVNEAYCKMSGYTKEELIDMSILDHSILESENSAKKRAQKIYEEGSELFESVHQRKDHTIFDVEISVSTLQGKEKKLIHFIRDITERKQLESYFLIEKELFKNTIHSAADAVISTDTYGRVVIMNMMAEVFTGWTKEEALYRPLEEVLHIHDIDGNHMTNLARESIRTRNTVKLLEDYRLITRGDGELFIELSAAPIIGSNNEIMGAVVTFKDISKRREEMKNIEDLSYRDALTGLFNRRYLDKTVENMKSSNCLPLAVMVVDVNGLKITNDAFGHSTGDLLLKEVARIIKKVTRQEDIICRTGGDEFVILLPRRDLAQAKVIKKRIVSFASKSKTDSLSISLAVGYSFMRAMDEEFENVLTEADNNMYRNKLRYGRNIKKKTIDKLMDKLNENNHELSQHNKEVAVYSEKIGIALGLEVDEIAKLKQAAILHDIGKVMVPKDILMKRGTLTEMEYKQLRKHSEIGYQLLKEVDEYKHLAEIVLSHHEWYNGAGYPRKLSGEEISLHSRIISVADSYETMIGIRGYKNSIIKEDAINELKSCSGTQFDPKIVEVFINQVLA